MRIRRDNAMASARRGWLTAVVALLALLAIGCEDDTAETPSATAEPPAARKVKPSGPIERLEAPDGVLLYGGADDVKALAKKLKKAYPKMGQRIDPALVGAQVGERFGMSDASALDLGEPIRLALLDPKSHDQPIVLLVSTKGEKAVEKSLPGTKKADDGGNDWSFQSRGAKAYVNMLDDWAVLTHEAKTFGEREAFFTQLAGAKLPAPATLVVDAAQAASRYESALDEAVAGMKAEVQAQEKKEAPAAVSGAAGMFEAMAGYAKQVDQLVVVLDTVDDGGLLKIDVHPKGGSELAEIAMALSGQELSMLDRAPEDAAAVIAMSVDPDEANELTDGLAKWSLNMMTGGKHEGEKYEEAMQEYWDASTGQMLFVAHEFEGDMRISGLFGVDDAERARKAQKEMWSMYDDPAVRKNYAALGMKASFEQDAYRVGEVPVSINEVQFEGKDDNPLANNPVMADLMSSHFAVGEKIGVIAYGTEGKGLITAWLEDEVEGGFAETANAEKALEYAAPGAFFLAWGEPHRLLTGLTGEPGNAPPSGRGLAISAGAKGGAMSLVIDLPRTALAQIVTMAGSAMRPRGL